MSIKPETIAAAYATEHEWRHRKKRRAPNADRDQAHRAALLAGLREAAGLADERNKSGDEWVPGSLWDRLHREFTARIRARIAEIEKGEAP